MRLQQLPLVPVGQDLTACWLFRLKVGLAPGFVKISLSYLLSTSLFSFYSAIAWL